MINKYTTDLEISKTIEGKQYYTSLIPSKVPQDTSQFTVVTRMGDRLDRKSTRLNSSHSQQSRMPSSA